MIRRVPWKSIELKSSNIRKKKKTERQLKIKIYKKYCAHTRKTGKAKWHLKLINIPFKLCRNSIDFKNKTAFCTARHYNSSTCGFCLAKEPTEKKHTTYWKIITGVKTSWRLCFLVELPCLWNWSSINSTAFTYRVEDATLTHLSYSCDTEGTVITAGRYHYESIYFISWPRVQFENFKNTYQNNVKLLQSCKLSLYEHLLTSDILQILAQDLVINGYLICSPLSQRGILPE